VKVCKLSVRDGDGLRQQAGVAVDLALLAVQPGSHPVGDVISVVSLEVVEFADAIAKVLKRKEIGAGRRATFGMGVAIPSVILLPANKELGFYCAGLWRLRPWGRGCREHPTRRPRL
jgi:hypothetical protein